MVESSQLKQRTFKGGKWLVINQAFNQSIRLLVSILLTRILLPDDFGVVAKTFAITGIAEMVFVQSTIGAIIQDKKITSTQIYTLFTITILWSVLVSGFMFSLANPISLFYEDNRVIWTTKIASLSIFFSGMGLVPSALLRKQLNFKKVAIASISALIVSSVIALYMANSGYGYRAIIIQFVSNSAINAIMLLILSGANFVLRFNFREVIEHIKFGLHVTGTNFLNYLVRNTDDISLGKFQPNEVLGLYSRAYFLMLTPINIVNQIFNQLLFPVFSIIQDNKKRVRNIFLKTQEIILISTYPAITLFYFNADTIVNYLLGPQWIESVTLFRLFVPLLLIQLFTSVSSNVFMTFNKTRFLLRFSLLTKPILIGAIIIAAIFGPKEVALTIVTLSGIFGLILYKKSIEIIEISFTEDILNNIWIFLGAWFIQVVLQIIIILFVIQEIQLYLSVLALIIFYVLVLVLKPGLVKELKALFKINQN